jgi:hypothetical protein
VFIILLLLYSGCTCAGARRREHRGNGTKPKRAIELCVRVKCVKQWWPCGVVKKALLEGSGKREKETTLLPALKGQRERELLYSSSRCYSLVGAPHACFFSFLKSYRQEICGRHGNKGLVLV